MQFIKRSLLIAAIAIVWNLTTQPVWETDVENGTKIFSANGAACHNSDNVAGAAKLLEKAALEQCKQHRSTQLLSEFSIVKMQCQPLKSG